MWVLLDAGVGFLDHVVLLLQLHVHHLQLGFRHAALTELAALYVTNVRSNRVFFLLFSLLSSGFEKISKTGHGMAQYLGYFNNFGVVEKLIFGAFQRCQYQKNPRRFDHLEAPFMIRIESIISNSALDTPLLITKFGLRRNQRLVMAWGNVSRIFIILVSLTSWDSGLSKDAKIIKINQDLAIFKDHLCVAQSPSSLTRLWTRRPYAEIPMYENTRFKNMKYMKTWNFQKHFYVYGKIYEIVPCSAEILRGLKNK